MTGLYIRGKKRGKDMYAVHIKKKKKKGEFSDFAGEKIRREIDSVL